MNSIVETLESQFEQYDKFRTPIKCNELKNVTDSYRNEQSWNGYKGLIKNVLESTAFYYTKEKRLLSLAIDNTNTLRDVLYIGLDDGQVLKIVLNTIDYSNLYFQPILIQKLMLFNSIPVTHLQIRQK